MMSVWGLGMKCQDPTHSSVSIDTRKAAAPGFVALLSL